MSILENSDELMESALAQTAEPPLTIHVREESDSPSGSESRVRMIMVGSLIVLAVVCVVARFFYPFDFMGDQSHGWLVDHLLPHVQSLVGDWSRGMMLFYPFGLLGVFMLERFFPADPTQKILSTGLIHDALWVVIRAVVGVMLVTAYARVLYRMYVDHLSFLTVPLAPSLPVAVRLVIAILIADLTQWIQHWLHHHVSWLWPFHAVHHSQRELNLFSEARVHSMEYLLRRPLALFPMLMLGLEAPEVTWWLLILSWHVRLYHANIRSNFGPLRYLIVTPQSHRVHHSLRAEHLNHNYGALLSVWDYLFRTQCREYDVYPETGIDDETFPAESARSVGGVLANTARQLLYPFQQLWTLGYKWIASRK